MTITITDEFREKVDKAARSVAGRSTQVEWEDVAQDIWVRMLEDQAYYDKLREMEDAFPSLKKIAKQEVYKANNAYEHFSGNYTYTPGEVRGLLNEYLFEVTIENIAESVDLVEGLLLLRGEAPGYFKTIIDKWVHSNEPNSGTTTKAVDKLTVLMNQVNQAARYSYEGVGSRRAVTNTQAIARKDNSWN